MFSPLAHRSGLGSDRSSPSSNVSLDQPLVVADEELSDLSPGGLSMRDAELGIANPVVGSSEVGGGGGGNSAHGSSGGTSADSEWKAFSKGVSNKLERLYESKRCVTTVNRNML